MTETAPDNIWLTRESGDERYLLWYGEPKWNHNKEKWCVQFIEGNDFLRSFCPDVWESLFPHVKLESGGGPIKLKITIEVV